MGLRSERLRVLETPKLSVARIAAALGHWELWQERLTPMIRRTVQLPDGGNAWVLIAQREHARLSSLLSTWCVASELPADEQAEVEWAILHHDDGWQEWDDLTSDAVARFGFSDDAAGPPRAFNEMRVEDANPIWAASIEAAARRSPFAAYLVARHFLNLRSASASSREPAAIHFAAHYEPFANACWEQWKSARAAALATCSLASQVPRGSPSNTPSGSASSVPLASSLDQIAARALNRLQWADFLSLRLCGTVPPSPTVLGPSPLGPKQVLTVVGSERLGFQAPIQYQLDPWTGAPLGRAFRLDAHLAAIRPYANVHDLKRSWKPVGILGVLKRSGCES